MTTYWISPTGSDSTGTGIDRTKPWKSLAAGTAPLGPGDILNMRAGTYSDRNLTWNVGYLVGTAASRITIQTDPLDLPSHAIFDGGAAAVKWLQVIECKYIDFKNFTVQNFGVKGNPDSGSGLWIGYSNTGGTNYSTNIRVRGCTFSRIGSGVVHDHAIYISYGSTDIEVSGCTFLGTIAGSCVQTDHTPGCKRAEIFNNLFAANAAHWGVVLNGDASAVHVTNNTFTGTLQIGIGFYNDFGGTIDTKVTNNIIRGCGTGMNSGYAPTRLSANCNCFFGNTLNVSGLTTGTNPVLADPKQVSYATLGTGDYHLATGSPCIAAGTATYVTGAALFDRDGLARPSGTGIDIGAYEYTGDIAAGDTTPPTLTLPTGVATGTTTATVGCTSNESGTLYIWITQNATETIANIVANGSTKAVVGTGIVTSNAAGLTPSTTYYAHMVEDDAALNRSNAVHSAAFTTSTPPDTTAPVLTLPTGASTGQTTATATVTTDEGNGTLYCWVTTNATETAANIVTNGQSIVVASTGLKTFSITALAANTTYFSHFVQDDAATNRSIAVHSSSFTTDAVPIPSANSPSAGGSDRRRIYH